MDISVFGQIRSAAVDGPAQAMETGSTKPKTSPIVGLALATRELRKQTGCDHGPLSVAAKLRRQGIQPPSRASLARIFMNRPGFDAAIFFEKDSDYAQEVRSRSP